MSTASTAKDHSLDESRNAGVSIALIGLLAGVALGSCLPFIVAGLLSVMVSRSSWEKKSRTADAES